MERWFSCELGALRAQQARAPIRCDVTGGTANPEHSADGAPRQFKLVQQ